MTRGSSGDVAVAGQSERRHTTQVLTVSVPTKDVDLNVIASARMKLLVFIKMDVKVNACLTVNRVVCRMFLRKFYR